MPVETAYIVQAFREAKDGSLRPDPPFKASSANAARLRADALAPSVAGVMAFEMTADVETGDYSEPIVLAKHGRVPPGLGDE